jgi:hypothetical protein
MAECLKRGNVLPWIPAWHEELGIDGLVLHAVYQHAGTGPQQAGLRFRPSLGWWRHEPDLDRVSAHTQQLFDVGDHLCIAVGG